MTRILSLLFALSCASPPASAGTKAAPALPDGQRAAVFAGGCFWCMEKPFEHVPGVLSVVSGYTGGPELHPSYDDVGHHRTGHLEAIRVLYDPDKVDYDALLGVFWHNIDPTQDDGQFCDKGNQYRTAIFTSDPAEKQAAARSRQAAAKQLGSAVKTRILEDATFWQAEDYHQDFYLKNPEHYARYRQGCGRDARLKQLWGEAAGR